LIISFAAAPGVAFAILATFCTPRAGAQDSQSDASSYPSRPVRMLVGFSPGGGSDLIARMLGKKLSEAWGKQVVVDNRAGGGGVIASDITSKATPDGYTLLMATSSLSIQPSVSSKLPFDTLRDFVPITLAVSNPYLLLLYPGVEANSVKELISLAKARPGKLNYATGGVGSTLHLTAELFNSMAGVNIRHVPYMGAVALVDLMAGQVEMAFFGIGTALPLVRSGKLKALAVTSAKRSATAPEIPSIAESGVPGYDVTAWYGLVAPARTDPQIIAKLQSEVVKALNTADSRQYLAAQGFDLIGSTSKQFATTIRDEIRQWAEVVRRVGIRMD